MDWNRKIWHSIWSNVVSEPMHTDTCFVGPASLFQELSVADPCKLITMQTPFAIDTSTQRKYLLPWHLSLLFYPSQPCVVCIVRKLNGELDTHCNVNTICLSIGLVIKDNVWFLWIVSDSLALYRKHTIS